MQLAARQFTTVTPVTTRLDGALLDNSVAQSTVLYFKSTAYCIAYDKNSVLSLE